MAENQSHEPVAREDVQMGSERSFGFVFAGAFAVVGFFKLFFGSGLVGWTWFWLAGSVAFLAIALVMPALLRPLNILWFKFGMLLNAIVSPLVMGLIFFLTVTPIGLLMRLTGNRPLNLEFDPEAESYWIERDPPGPAAGSFKNQF